MHELRDKVLGIVRISGPIIPVQISRAINTDILLASAILSELVSQKQLYMTNAKIGGSPMYYAKGQEEKLQVLYTHLGERLKNAFDLIKEKKVLRDKILEPWQRVAIRQIKDFAIMLKVNIREDIEIFWKWYLTSDDEAKNLILNLVKEDKELQVPINEKEQEVQEQLTVKDVKKPVISRKEAIKKDKDYLKNIAYKYFEKNNIKVLSEQLNKKNKEFELLAEVKSDIGKLNFFVKVVDKKKLNEGDLGLAHSRAKGKPILLLTTGELTNKAREYLEKNLKGSLIIETIS